MRSSVSFGKLATSRTFTTKGRVTVYPVSLPRFLIVLLDLEAWLGAQASSDHVIVRNFPFFGKFEDLVCLTLHLCVGLLFIGSTRNHIET